MKLPLTWNNQDWLQEDLDYSPKRRVDNKISWQKPHIIGSFQSKKMQRTVEYHSLNECLFYYFLEVDVETRRYYVQPVEVPIPIASMNAEKKYWLHVPDVLVFRDNYPPFLYQIKEASGDLGETFRRCNDYCTLLAHQKNWRYDIIYPKTLPPVVLRNIEKLQGYLRERPIFELIRKDVLFKLDIGGSMSIDDLSKSFYPTYCSADVKPFLYHLVAIGEVETDMNVIISKDSVIKRRGNAENGLNVLYQSAFSGGE